MKNKEISFKRTVQVVDGIPVEVVATQKFKTITIALYFIRPLENYQNALNALTLNVMIKACSKMDPMMLNQRLQELYGAYLQADAYKYGDQQSLQLKLTLVGDNHVDEPLFDQAMDLIYDLIQKPVSDFSGFEHLVALEKKQLLGAIATRKNDKTAYAFDLLLEGCFKEQPYSLSPYGEASIIESLTPDEVRLQIETVFQNSPHKLVVLGDIDPEIVYKALKRQNLQSFNPSNHTKGPTKGPALDQIEKKQEKSKNDLLTWRQADKITQSKLNMAYRLPEALDHKDYYAMMLFSHLLGGGGGSILFEDLREKQSLCYYIHARIDKFIRLLTVMSGVQKEVLDRVSNSVAAHITHLQTELVDPIQLERAKKMLLSSYGSLSDSPSSYINFIYSQELVGLPADLDVISNFISQVDCEMIRMVANKITPLAIFALIPESEGGQND